MRCVPATLEGLVSCGSARAVRSMDGIDDGLDMVAVCR